MQAQISSEATQPTRPCRSLLLVKRKKFKNVRQCHGKRGNQKQGMWNLTQTQNYIEFVKNHPQKLLSQENRRESKVFCLMARHIRTRTAVQCRSHHQKMVQTHKDLPSIIHHYEQTVIPFYSSKLSHFSETKSSEIPEQLVIPCFYSIEQKGNCFRIQIDQECIGTY